jgi:hypothetical protein
MSQKLLFKFKYLKLELEETNNLDSKYSQEFNKDFREEIEFLNEINSKNNGKNEPIDNKVIVGSSQKDISNIPQDFKEIYKIMIREFHPDLKTEELKHKYEELLKKVTSAYENKRWLEMITIAHEEGITLPSNLEIHKQIFEKNLNEIEEKISHIKNKLSWVWSSKLKPDKSNKEKVYSFLDINLEKFEEWKRKKNQ